MKHQAIRHLIAMCTLIVAVITSMFIIGEVTLQLRSGSPTGYAVAYSSTLPAGYMTPFDVFESTTTPVATLTALDNGDGTFDGTFNYAQTGGYVYEKFYVLREGAWLERTLTRTNPTSPWIPNSAVHTIPDLNYNDFLLFPDDDDLFVAFYTCKKWSNVWRCGCSDTTNCADIGDYHWMIQSYNLGVGETGLYLEFNPRERAVTSGSTVSFDIELNGFTDVYGFDFDVEYDPAVLSNPVLSHGGILGTPANGYPGNTTSPAEFLCLTPTITSGAVRNIACTATGATVPNDVNTVAKRITFTVSGASGSYSQVRVTNSEIAQWSQVATDETGTLLNINNYNVNDGAVIVT